MSSPRDVTELLVAAGNGDRGALDEMLPLVYAELRNVAERYLRRERRDHTLQPTALVHEAYIRLINQREVDWRNRAHFVGVAAEMMRRILVNHAEARAAGKRGGGAERVTLDRALLQFQDRNLDVIEIDGALKKLAEQDPRAARIVELRFFGGLTNEEIAEVLTISERTIDREYAFARAWLQRSLRPAPGSGGAA
jgi:RNA polymerase sigma-70 factor (ECF subfamily)